MKPWFETLIWNAILSTLKLKPQLETLIVQTLPRNNAAKPTSNPNWKREFEAIVWNQALGTLIRNPDMKPNLEAPQTQKEKAPSRQTMHKGSKKEKTRETKKTTHTGREQPKKNKARDMKARKQESKDARKQEKEATKNAKGKRSKQKQA